MFQTARVMELACELGTSFVSVVVLSFLFITCPEP